MAVQNLIKNTLRKQKIYRGAGRTYGGAGGSHLLSVKFNPTQLTHKRVGLGQLS